MRPSTFHAVLAFLVLGHAAPAFAEQRSNGQAGEPVVTYEVAFPAPQTQMVEIAMTAPCAGEGAVEVMLPAWRPGRYSILDPASGLRDVRATSTAGEELLVHKIAKAAWRVETGGADAFRFRYRLYANSIGDRTRHVDATHAFLSGSAVFVYSPRLRGARVRVELDLPAGWEVATGLEEEDGALVAASYDVLVDSPLELGLHDRHAFEALGKPHELVVWPPGVEYDADRVTGDLTKIVETQAAIFGGDLPYSRYVFLVHAGAGGGGTEHLNSTIMQTPRAALEESLDEGDAYRRFLGLAAHEFFHTWNVKQLRPAGIHPYDYQSENYTDLLWVAEGGTSYFGDLSLARAGLKKPKKYLDGLGKAIDALRTRPGAEVQSVAASSFDAWTKGSQRSADDVNSEVSFYSKGLLVCLLLDLELRTRTENAIGLDGVVRTMFERYPLSGSGYTSADLENVLGMLSYSSFEEFFASFVDGTEPLPFEEVLPVVGLELYLKPEKKDEDEASEEEENGEAEDEDGPLETKAYLGLRMNGARVGAVLADGPAYAAGVLPGDEIVALNGRRPGDMDKRLKRLEPGDTVTLHLFRRDELLVLEVVLGGVPAAKWTVRRVKEPTGAQKAAYEAWLGQPWPEKKTEEKAPEPEDG